MDNKLCESRDSLVYQLKYCLAYRTPSISIYGMNKINRCFRNCAGGQNEL